MGAAAARPSTRKHSKRFERLALAAGLDSRTRLHDLRDAVATHLARKGLHPKHLRDLGHSSVAFSWAFYTGDLGRSARPRLPRLWERRSTSNEKLELYFVVLRPPDLGFLVAGREGLEPPTTGFGDRRSTN